MWAYRVSGWANRKDELRAHEAKMFEEAKRELDVVEAKLDAIRLEDEAEAEAKLSPEPKAEA